MHLQEDVAYKLYSRLYELEEQNDVFTYFGYFGSIARHVIINTTNVTRTFEIVYKKPKGLDYTAEEKELYTKLKEVQCFTSKYSPRRDRPMPWNENALKVAMENHMNHRLV